MKGRPERDIEKVYSTAEFVAKLPRPADVPEQATACFEGKL